LGVAFALAVVLVPVCAEDDKDAPVKLTAEEFDKEFRQNKKAAAAKYQGKKVELTGTVLRVNRHFSGKPVVELNVGNEAAGVACYTTEKEPWGTFAPGQKVKVVGTVPGFPVKAEAEECAVEAVTESPLKTAAAEALAKECAADPAGTNKAYAKQTLKVSGTITAVFQHEDGVHHGGAQRGW